MDFRILMIFIHNCPQDFQTNHGIDWSSDFSFAVSLCGSMAIVLVVWLQSQKRPPSHTSYFRLVLDIIERFIYYFTETCLVFGLYFSCDTCCLLDLLMSYSHVFDHADP